MSEILIKNMEMPKDMGNPLHISIFSNGSVWITHEGKTEATAQELPPHGDLIDRDKLYKDTERIGEYCHDPSFIELCQALYDAPTVLEASKGRE